MSYQSDVFEQPQVLRTLVHTYEHHQAWPLLSVYLNQQGKTALHLETSALIHYLPTLLEGPSIIVAVSQSGESIEIQKLVAAIEARRHYAQSPILISVTNSAHNTLADQSDVALPTTAGPEVGIATKTYTSSMLVLHFVARALAGHIQPQDFEYGVAIASQTQTLLKESQTTITTAFNTLKSSTYLAIIGRGPALATANNAALMFKEGVRLPAEGYSGGQFRHGPREMIVPNIGAIVLTSPDTTLGINQKLASDISDYGGQAVCIGHPTPGIPHIPLPELEDMFLHPMLEILPVQLLVAQLADHRKLTPGEFRWSGKVVAQE